MLGATAGLADDSVVAATGEVAELVAARTGTTVLAVSDRPTAVFSRSWAEARQRQQSARLLVGPPSVPDALRHAAARRFNVTHRLLEGAPCDDTETVVAKAEDWALCGRTSSETGRGHGSSASPLAEALSEVEADGECPVASRCLGARTVLARFPGDLECLPTPQKNRAVARWTRESRFSGKPVVLRCRYPLGSGSPPEALAVALALPQASDAIVWTATRATGIGGPQPTESRTLAGMADFKGSGTATISLPHAEGSDSLDTLVVELSPTSLPYINVREILILGAAGR